MHNPGLKESRMETGGVDVSHTAVVVRPTTKFRRWPNVDAME